MDESKGMSGHNPQLPPPALCALCVMWGKLPHGARYTTPVSVAETEVAMVAGFWVRSRHPEDLAIRLCDRHASIVESLDMIEAHRAATSVALETAATVKPFVDPIGRFEPTPFFKPVITESLLPASMAVPGICDESVTDTLKCARKAGHKGSHSTVADPPETKPEPQLVGGIVQQALGGIPVEIQTATGTETVIAEQGSQESYPCPLCHKMAEPGKLHACVG